MNRRDRNKILITLMLSAIILPLGCEKNEQQPEEIARSDAPQLERAATPEPQNSLLPELLDRLKQGKDIHPLLSSEIVFVFHSDDRCSGSTDGIITTLPANSIDSPFIIQVTNDGDGWTCEKREPSEQEMEFDLKQHLAQWDRIEVSENSQQDGPFYIEGGGESDYIVIHVKRINARDVIYKFEYRSEDPG